MIASRGCLVCLVAETFTCCALARVNIEHHPANYEVNRSGIDRTYVHAGTNKASLAKVMKRYPFQLT